MVTTANKIMNWDEYNAERDKKKKENYDRAVATFTAVQELARLNGFSLVQYSTWHFSLTYLKDGKRQWRINLHPSNQRIWADRKCGKAPFLEISTPWTFLDVVCAAMIQTQLPPKKLTEALK
jgi:hypothetical protein